MSVLSSLVTVQSVPPVVPAQSLSPRSWGREPIPGPWPPSYAVVSQQAHPSFPRRETFAPPSLPRANRRSRAEPAPEKSGAGTHPWPLATVLRGRVAAAPPSFPRRREPIPGPWAPSYAVASQQDLRRSRDGGTFAQPFIPTRITVVPAEAGTHPRPLASILRRRVAAGPPVVPAEAGTHPRPLASILRSRVAAGPPSFPRRRDLCTTVHSHAHNRRSRGGGNPSPAPGLHPTPSCRSRPTRRSRDGRPLHHRHCRAQTVVPAEAGTHPRPLASILRRRVAAGPPVVPATGDLCTTVIAARKPSFPRRACPREVGGGNPSLAPGHRPTRSCRSSTSVVPATAGTHPRPLGSVLRRCVAAGPPSFPRRRDLCTTVHSHAHNRRSRGGGNPSPAPGLHPTPSCRSRPTRRSRDGGNPSPTPGHRPTPSCRTSTSVVPATAGTHPRPLGSVLRHRVAPVPPSFPRRREPIPGPWAPSYTVVSQQAHPSFPRRREPIPGPGLRPTQSCRSSTSVIPAESLPRTRYGAGTHPRPWPLAYTVVSQQYLRRSRGEPAPYSIRGGNPSPAPGPRPTRSCRSSTSSQCPP